MRIRPLNDRVVVKPLEELARTAGGIVIPVAAGRGVRLKDGSLRPLEVKTGDKLLFGEYAGHKVKVRGEELIVMREDDIIGILDA
jgi:chaperonin GroES